MCHVAGSCKALVSISGIQSCIIITKNARNSGMLSLGRWVTESGVDPGGDVLAVKPATAAMGVGYLRARGAEEAMEAAKAMLDQARALFIATFEWLRPARMKATTDLHVYSGWMWAVKLLQHSCQSVLCSLRLLRPPHDGSPMACGAVAIRVV